MFALITPKYNVSSIMGYLKGKSSLMVFLDRHANLKYKYGIILGAVAIYVYTVGKNSRKRKESHTGRHYITFRSTKVKRILSQFAILFEERLPLF